jgi:hypothetical protein
MVPKPVVSAYTAQRAAQEDGVFDPNWCSDGVLASFHLCNEARAAMPKLARYEGVKIQIRMIEKDLGSKLIDYEDGTDLERREHERKLEDVRREVREAESEARSGENVSKNTRWPMRRGRRMAKWRR